MNIKLSVVCLFCFFLTLHESPAQKFPPEAEKFCALPPPVKDTCASVGINRSCTVTIDRLIGAQPLTVYSQRNSRVTVRVFHSSPWETLSLDFKSATIVLPPDAYQSGFAALLTPLKTFKISTTGSLQAFDLIVMFPSPGEIALQDRQDLLLQKADIYGPLREIKNALTAIPPDICRDPKTPIPKEKNIWLDPKVWQAAVVVKLNGVIKGKDQTKADLLAEAAVLRREVEALPPARVREGQNGREQLIERQRQLDIALASFFSEGDRDANLPDIKSKIIPLAVVISTIKPSPAVQSVGFISDGGSTDGNYLGEIWTINYANAFEVVAKKVFTKDPYPTNPLASLTEAPAKQPLTSIGVQFQKQPRIEIVSGLVVPVLPSHSYKKTAVFTNGVVTDNKVQESTSWVPVPMVLGNFRLSEGTGPHNRWATFASTGIGYNPASSAVEFGLGFSFAWKSIVINTLADIGRDTRLTQNFKPNDTLGSSGAPDPPTEQYWKVSPAFGLSVRIPLGGASK